MTCRGCGNENAFQVRTHFDKDMNPIDSCNHCSSVPVGTFHDCYVPVGGMFFEHLSHPDYPESHGGTFCPDKATKAYYLKKYGLQEAGDAVHGTNKYDPIAGRYARESLRR